MDAPLSCGVDLVDLDGWRRALEVGGEAFCERNFTEGERAWCAGDPARLAARFAAKEAVAKALGTGFRDGVEPGDIEVVSAEHGQPTLRLHGEASARARALRLDAWRLSLAHGERQVVAFVVACALPAVGDAR
ncbi:holo-ACP synthase [Deinococcus aestuarii]|uniref:holo-ACP synthase n=1 Tax=Deinococcus aestuarii TaxID=2774531 RepID=UPI001C0E4CE2|nr:holo-ACP synthase [Deinococcus aestuarii]